MTERAYRAVAFMLCLLLASSVAVPTVLAASMAPLSHTTLTGAPIRSDIATYLGTIDINPRRIFGQSDTITDDEDVNNDGEDDFRTEDTKSIPGKIIVTHFISAGPFFWYVLQQTFPVRSSPEATPALQTMRSSLIAASAVGTHGIFRPGATLPDGATVLPYLNQFAVLLNNGDGTFADPTFRPVGVSNAFPTAIAVGEVTGDSRADIVLADAGNNAVIVLPGNGDGTFGTPVSYSLGGTSVSPDSIAVADLNGDGKMDIVTGNIGSVSVLLNNGSGGFLPAVTYTTGITANCTSGCGATLALDNLNADNKPDIVTTTTLANATQIAVLLNHGDGTFGTAVPYAVGSGPLAITTGDVNGDHHADIAVANNSDSTVSILINHGDGTFAPQVAYPVSKNPTHIALFDQTRHGKLDLLAWGNSGGVLVLPGNGDGTFPTLDYLVGKSPLDVFAADVNGDNKPDLLSVNHNDGITGSLSVLINNGSGGFTPASGSPISINDSIFSLAAADFTGDNKTDVAVGGFNLTLLTGNGSGGFTVGAPILSLFGYFIATVTVDVGNGHPDLVVADQNTNAVYVLLNDGHGNFSEASGSPISLGGATPVAIAVKDINADNKPDLIVSRTDGKVSVFLGNGSGGFTPATGSPITIATGAGSVAVTDVNGDNKPDLIVTNSTTGVFFDAVSVLLGNGNGTFGTPITVPADTNVANNYYGSLAVTDLNGDGIPDLAVGNGCSRSDGTACPVVSLYSGKGDGTFVAAGTYEAGGDAQVNAIRAADINGDGHTDLVTAGNNAFGNGVIGLMRNATIPASAATHLAFAVTVPTPLAAGKPFGATVLAEDASNNIVTGFGGAITLALNGGSGLGGTLTQTASGGGALFQGLTIANAGSGLSLTATSGSLSGTSSAFVVTAPANPLPPPKPGGPAQVGAPGVLPPSRQGGPTQPGPVNPLPSSRP